MSLEINTFTKVWASTKLGEIASWGSGGTPSRKNKEYYSGTIPWVKTGDLGPRVLKNVNEYITEEAVKNSSAKLFQKGSVALAMYGATIGKTSILGIDCTTNQACAVGKPNNSTTTDFLYYLLISEKNNFIAKGKGGAQPNISQTIIKSHHIFLPALAEQKEIVRLLDTHLATVTQIQARLDAIPKILEKFRQSVLSDAVSGRLTEDAPNFELLKLGDLIDLQYGKALPAKNRSGVGYPVYGSNGEVGRHKEYYTEGPFIIVGRKGSFGIVTWSSESGWAIDTAYYVELKRQDDLKYIYYLLQTLELTTLNRSTAIPGLNRNDAYSQPVKIPDLKTQKRVVCLIESYFTYIGLIEKSVAVAKARVDNLTQSILHQAFTGQLTAEWRGQNPELISGDNSAEALLARIQAEG